MRIIPVVLTILLLSNCNSSPLLETDLRSMIDSLHIEKDKLYISIDKSEFFLEVCYDKLTLKRYPIVLGANPVDDKRMEGDACTPEGHFKIRDLYPHKSWSKFIWIDYPTDNSKRLHDESKSIGEIPANATIGGEIGIHGVPANKDYLVDDRTNWTLGCISLKNTDVNEIYSICFEGMPVFIKK